MRYSPSTHGFYPADTAIVHYDLPDLVDVTDKQAADITEALMAGDLVALENGELVITPVDLVIVTAREQASAWANYQLQAKQALKKTSVTIERCFENGISLPLDWVTYRKQLRAILGDSNGDPTQPLPAQPAYPVGT